MKRGLIGLFVLLSVAFLFSSCMVMDQNSFVWYAPDIFDYTVVTNIYDDYYYEVDTNFSLLSDGIITITNLFADFKYYLVVNAKVKKTKVTNFYTTYHKVKGKEVLTSTLDYWYYWHGISIDVYISNDSGSRNWVGWKYFDIREETNVSFYIPFTITNTMAGKAYIVVYARYVGLVNEGYVSEFGKYFQKETFVRLARSCYVETIPLSNNLSNFPDTAIYLYRNNGMEIESFGEDDDSGYSNVMAKLYKPMAPGVYYAKVISKTTNSNTFAIYYGYNKVDVNDYVSVSEYSNYSLDSALELTEGVPTNSWIDAYTERWYKIVVSNY